MPQQIAILCSGLDNVLRGYETHCRTLFHCLSKESTDEFEFMLFKRQGPKAPREVILKVPYRSGFICQTLAKFRGDLLYWEYLFFALRFVAYCTIRRKKFKTISVIEPMAAKTIFRLRAFLPGKPKIVFTHGVWNAPVDNIKNGDVFHEVGIENYQAMNTYVKENKLQKQVVLLPHFLEQAPLQQYDKQQLRKEFGIRTSHVIVSVGAINRSHKRMDYVINEVSKLPDNWSLLVCGGANGADGQSLLDFGKQKLGDRFIHKFLSRDKIGKAYSVSDLFVLGSTQEGFGIVILEAMSYRLPVVLHKKPLFEWILKQPDCCIDMTREDELADFIRIHGSDDSWIHKVGEENYNLFVDQYSWKGVREGYLDLFTK